MNQLAIPFELHLIDVLKGEQKSLDYLRINPLGVVPYLITDDGQGIGESNAMLWYLAQDTDLMPQSKAAQAEALQWMFFEQSKLEPFISPARFFTTILPSERAARSEDIATWQMKAADGLETLNNHLYDRTFMLDGGYSITDIAMFGYVHVIEEADISMAEYPAIAAWASRVSETNGFVPLAQLGQKESAAA